MLIHPAVARDFDRVVKRVVEAEEHGHERADPAVYRRGGNKHHGETGSRPELFRFRLGTLLFVVAILALLLVVAIQEVQILGQQAKIRAMTREQDTFYDHAKLISDQAKLVDLHANCRILSIDWTQHAIRRTLSSNCISYRCSAAVASSIK